MLNVTAYLQTKEFKDYNVISTNMKNNISSVVAYYFADKPMFQPKNIQLYYYDEQTLQTNVSSNLLTLYLEINQPNNFKSTNAKKEKNKFVKDAHLTLKQIKSDLYDVFMNSFSQDILVGKTKFGIVLQTMERMNDIPLNFYINIIPCFTYSNQNKVDGVLYYSDNGRDVIIDFPKQSMKNFKNKNKETNGLLADYTIIFKNLYMQQKKLNQLPFELFELMLFNVPNSVFRDLSQQNLVHILNHLRNLSMQDFITIDQQDRAFVTSYRAFSILYVRHALKQIAKAIRKKI